jgi:hypothetical protein
MTVINDGRIFGINGAGVYATDVSNLDLTNTGKIFGQVVAVYVSVQTPGLGDGPTIENSGPIHAGLYGILGQLLPGQSATVVNKSGGTIEGQTNSVTVNGGNLSLDNYGKLKGDVMADNAKDKVVNAGTIKGEVFLEAGNDTYKNDGGTAGKVHGGFGNDTLIAGPHTDKFVFDTPLDPVNNVDRVKHFDPGTDKLFLDKAFFGALTGPGPLKGSEFHIGNQAQDTDEHIIYNKHTGALIYDFNGSTTGGEVQFAKLDKGLNLHHDDFVVFV